MVHYSSNKGGQILSLAISYDEEPLHRNKEIQVISLEQIVGQHLKFDELLGQDIRKRFTDLELSDPTKYHLHKNVFTVKSPNNSDITRSANGKSPWFLVRGLKTGHQQINMLFLGPNLWGLEIAAGYHLKKSTEKFGKEKITQFLSKQVESILHNPDDWQQIQGYCI